MEDARGVTRGACTVCQCPQYQAPQSGTAGVAGTNWKCSACSHFPPKHLKLGVLREMCKVRGCYQRTDFDLNTGVERQCCAEHEAYENVELELEVEDIEDEVPFQQPDYYSNETIIPQYPPYPNVYPEAVYMADGITPMQYDQQVQVVHNTVVPDQYQYGPQTIVTPDQMQAGVAPVAVGPSHHVVQCLVPGVQKCAIEECPNPSYTDENGTVHKCCGRTHAKEYEQRQSQQITAQQMTAQQMTASPGQAPSMAGPSLPPGVTMCAIVECQNPCFVDEAGTVHECCGIMHAMEHQRRKSIEQQKQVVKGVTHCLLPECNQLVWPFKNYCGKTHADIGRQRGLAPPPPPVDPSAPKDSSLCIIPGCTAKKFADPQGITHPYCGKSHAELGKKMNILPTADKKEDQCDLPGCQAPKRTEGTRVHDYCCAAHAQQDAPNRDARILTDMTAVKKFLDGFPKLKGYSISENPDAKPPGGSLFKRFKQKYDSLAKNQRVTCLAFHGTADKNISSICKNGYDPKLRSGQAYGTGEYFATTPDTPMNYCKGGKRMLLNELLLGQQGTHHTKHGVIVVMKDPAHDLPRFIVTFR